MRCVVVESPWRARTPDEETRNLAYAIEACRDCLVRFGEAPFASHLLYAHNQILDEAILSERDLGIKAGLAYCAHADATVVYEDYGISPGMQHGIQAAIKAGRPVFYRKLFAHDGGTLVSDKSESVESFEGEENGHE